MNELQVFTNEQFGSVRIKEIDGEPWFIAADVCKALELGNATMALDRLDADERTLISIEGSRNGVPVNAVNEAGLYILVMGSRTTSIRLMMLIPSLRVCRILISRRILVFLTVARSGVAGLTGLEDLDDDALVVLGVDPLVDLRVLAATNLLDDLVILLRAARVSPDALTRT